LELIFYRSPASRIIVAAIVALLVASLTAPSAAGFFCTAPSLPSRARHGVEFAVGYSPESSTWIGTMPDRRFLMVGINYSYRCWDVPAASIHFSPGLMPLAMLLQPDQVETFPAGLRTIPAHGVYGFGITPLSFTAEIAPERRLRPLAEAAGGVIASTEPIPLRQPNATGLNFLFYFGGALRWQARPYAALTLGYRFLHISNAGTTAFNPGVDNNVLYVGYSFFP
jgi:hypothetical protein